MSVTPGKSWFLLRATLNWGILFCQFPARGFSQMWGGEADLYSWSSFNEFPQLAIRNRCCCCSTALGQCHPVPSLLQSHLGQLLPVGLCREGQQQHKSFQTVVLELPIRQRTRHPNAGSQKTRGKKSQIQDRNVGYFAMLLYVTSQNCCHRNIMQVHYGLALWCSPWTKILLLSI